VLLLRQCFVLGEGIQLLPQSSFIFYSEFFDQFGCLLRLLAELRSELLYSTRCLLFKLCDVRLELGGHFAVLLVASEDSFSQQLVFVAEVLRLAYVRLMDLLFHV